MNFSTSPQIALIGNPNTGKTTLFNALTGLRHKVGNYPGVTVERKLGRLRLGDYDADLIDLPGIYSLAAQSPDEMVAVDMIAWAKEFAEERVDMLVVILDVANLRRNLYLYSQLLETDRPVVVALTMLDVADDAGITLDIEEFQRRLGVPVVPVNPKKGRGLEALRAQLSAQLATIDQQGHEAALPPAHQVHDADVVAGVARLAQAFRDAGAPAPPEFVRLRMLFDREGHLLDLVDERTRQLVVPVIDQIRDDLTDGRVLPAIEAHARYTWISELLDGVLEKPAHKVRTLTDRIDDVITHKVWGTTVFAVVMVLIFQAIFSWSAPLMDSIDAVFGSLGTWVHGMMPPGALRSLVVDGIIAGAGGVLIFIPQIFVLFLFIAVLEDCGYLARAAVLMDKLMSKVGLSGKSFIPMLSGFACAVPAIMATKTIADRKDRLATILVTPLMSCSARLPVYTLLIAAFVPGMYVGGMLNLQGLVLAAMYAVGIFVAVPLAFLFKKTLLNGPTPTFVMELPSYKLPSATTVISTAFERAKAFVKDAGTVILAVSIIVWALAYFPRSETIEQRFETARHEVEAQVEDPQARATALSQLEAREEAAAIENSYLARMGKAVEPAFAPLGWDWKITMGVIASFPAREIIVATLGTIYSVGSDADEESEGLRDALHQSRHPDGSKVFTLPVALSIMIFFALCMQCAATLAVMRRETGSWKWPAISFTSMTLLAYVAAFAVTYIGSAIS